MKNLIAQGRALISADALMETAAGVSGFHRIQASTGFRRSAEYCVQRLGSLGIEAQMVSFPADGKRTDLTHAALLEWDISGGGCEVEGLGSIADYGRKPLSVIPRSMPCDFRNTPLEIVYLDKSEDINDYEGIDLAGKLAFVRGNINSFGWAVSQKGAVGLITDYVLHPDTQQDVIRYTSFWWKDEAQPKYFGFAMPPSLGKKLAQLCLTRREQNIPVLARGHIESRLYAGELDVVSAFIPGETDEEIWLLAHLCHPQTSSNDNASGVSAGIHAMEAVKKAASGGLKLRRGVRLLLIPEMSGTVAYLNKVWGTRHKVLAGLNLDMVGGRQQDGYGPLALAALPRCTPSFIDFAAMQALEEAAKLYPEYDAPGSVPGVITHIAEYSTGSDHYILNDPTVGIPCAKLGQWPDKFYHTSGDTMDMLCPRVLKTSCTAAFGFAAKLAALETKDLPAVFTRGKTRYAQELEMLCGYISDAQPDGAWVQTAFAHYHAFYRGSFDDARRFFPGGEADGIIEEAQQALSGLDSAYAPAGAAPAHAPAASLSAPRRKYAMPCEDIDYAAKAAGKAKALDAYRAGPRKGLKNAGRAETMCEYYMDGRRTLGEIVALVEVDLRQEAPALADYVALLEDLNLVEML